MVITFDELRAANLARLKQKWPEEDPWGPADWSNALAGETGEMIAEMLTLASVVAVHAGHASNLTKKMGRMWPAGEIAGAWNHKPEDQRLDELRGRVMGELADMVIYADLLAAKLRASLGEEVRETFNAKSIEIESTVKL